MIIKDRDLYTQAQTVTLSSNGNDFGFSVIQYEVQKYVDTRNLERVPSFVVTCTQRLVIPNTDAFAPVGGQITGFTAYPALFTSKVELQDPEALVESLTLIDYSPKTLNTSVTTSQNDGDSTSTSNSQQYSSGSSTAQTNSFDASISLGFFGDQDTGDFGLSKSSSTTNERSIGRSFGRAVDTGAQYSNASSMSLKDWGAYAQLDDTTGTVPTWIWGQEYPWNLIQFRNEDSNDNVILPEYVQARLYDGVQVYPPSELSLFGVDVVSKVSWLVTPKAGIYKGISISFQHTVTPCVATHTVNDGVLTASIDTWASWTQTIATADLSVLALDPIGPAAGPALVGFVANQFEAPPSSAGQPFAITGENNLMRVQGEGFTGVTFTDFSAGEVGLAIYFKIIDTGRDINLSLKHWVNLGGACRMTIWINGVALPERKVTAPAGGMGADNVLVVPLRCKDFTSIDYCDFLQYGANLIEIRIQPAAQDTTYTLQAAAVG